MELIFVVIFVALVFEYINGFHDTANSIATVVSTKVMTPRQAIILAALTNLFGALAGFAVAKTVSSGLVDSKFVTSHTIICAMLGGIVWNLVTWWFGMPSSSTHALVGGLCGAAVGTAHGMGLGNIWSAIIWSERSGDHWWEYKGVLYKVVIPMFTSPLCGFVGGMIVMSLLYVLLLRVRPVIVNRTFGKVQILSAAYMGFSHGTNDAQKTMGIIALALAAGTAAGTFDNISPTFRWLYNPETGPAVYAAETRLAEMYLKGEGVEPNPKKAVHLLDRAAKGKNVEAAALLGELHLRGEHVKRDPKAAAKLLATAADKNVPSAMIHYATLLREGQGVTAKDESKAAALLAAASTNAPPKKFSLASKKFKEAPTNAADFVPWLQKKAAANNADAQVALGVLHQQGKGVPQDDAQALQWFEKAAARHVPEGIYNLGLMHQAGKGVPADPAKAASYFKAAADSEGIKLWIKITCALIMAAGTAAGGWRIIKTLGHKMVKLHPVHGFAAETTAASVLYTAAFFGMPVSTTHAISTSIMGVGSARRLSALKLGVVERILWAWVMTIPATAGLAFLFMKVCHWVGWA